jgi:penicillin-binding protein 1A
MWYGFDKPGNSLGISQTGEMLTAPRWGNYMRDIHSGLPQKSFTRPSGIADAAVCRGSGLLMTDSCTQGAIWLPFLAGTVPNRYCDIHGSGGAIQTARPATTTPLNNIDTSFLDDIPRPKLSLDLFPELQNPQTQPGNRNNRTQPGNNSNQQPTRPSFDNLFDDELPENTPANNSRNNTRNDTAVIPDTAVRFDPREEDNSDEDDDDYLPAWDQLD